jgi:hypothetical protein
MSRYVWFHYEAVRQGLKLLSLIEVKQPFQQVLMLVLYGLELACIKMVSTHDQTCWGFESW